MELLLIIIILGIVGFIFYQKLQQAGGNAKENEIWPYKRKSLMTATEKRFFQLLHEALPEHQVFVQVALNQMIKVDTRENWATWYSRIAQMSVDFVVSNNDGFIIAAIELDDKSHDNAKSKEKDAKKDKALNTAGIQVLRYRATSMPDISTIRTEIEKIHALNGAEHKK